MRAPGLVLVVCALVFSFCVGARGQGTLTQVLNNGPTDRRLNIVILSEGFRASEMSVFRTRAEQFVNTFLGMAPFNEYRTYFNAFTISVASVDSGSDHPSQGIFRNTYFNSTYESYGTERLLTIPPNDFDGSYANGMGRVDNLLMNLMPEWDIRVLLVNDEAYGGSGGSVAIASINDASAEIAIHELGHSFARLGDEYSAPFPGYPDIEEPNTTRETRREFIRWNPWILASTPIPTPTTQRTVIGLFEGAHYHATGWYRPKFDCKMRTLGQPFCAVCAETFVVAIYERIRPIDAALPDINAVHSITNRGGITFSVAPLQPVNHELSVRWLTNGVVVAGQSAETFTVTAEGLAPGANTVSAEIRDNTALVRRDPLNRLTQTVGWNARLVIERPTLAVALDAQFVILRYPTSAADFILEAAGTLAADAQWLPLAGEPETVGNEFVARVSAGGSERYFRLRQP